MSAVLEFLHMGGYAIYVWGSYGCVLAFLFAHWFFPWHRWQNYLREQNKS